MSFTESKYELSKILSLLAILIVIATLIIAFGPQIEWGFNLPENTELNYTGNVTEIEVFDRGLFNAKSSQTLVRFDDGNTLLFQHLEMEIPLNKEVTFYYHDNGYEDLFLDRFEVVK